MGRLATLQFELFLCLSRRFDCIQHPAEIVVLQFLLIPGTLCPGNRDIFDTLAVLTQHRVRIFSLSFVNSLDVVDGYC